MGVHAAINALGKIAVRERFGQARILLGRAPTRTIFLVDAPCGAILTTTIDIVWKPDSARSPEDDNIYDACLVRQDGNTVACDATIRLLERGRAART
jgi:hypothetical protein